MSIRAQIAFGKNYTLQKQLEDKYLNLRRMFKHSRRRLDTMEEECVAALYKLLLYAKETEGLTDAGEMNVFKDPFSKPKSAVSQRSKSAADMYSSGGNDIIRPATAMSAKAYTQSFSFVKDGLNIERTRRDRFMRTKAEREKDKENRITIERLTDDWQMAKENDLKTSEDNTGVELLGNKHTKEEVPARPKTAHPQVSRKPEFKGILSRPRTSNTLRLPQGTSTPTLRTTTPFTDFDISRADSPSEYTYTEEVIQDQRHFNGSTANGGRSPSPCLKTVHESRTRIDGTKSPLVVRITTTRPQEAHHREKLAENAEKLREDSMSNSSDDEDLIPLGEEDERTLKKLTTDDQKDINKCRQSPNRHRTLSRQAPSRNDLSTLPDNSLLRKSAKKTQSFLAQYSKKSRVIGYVMKTRSSVTAPRERLISHRSPCITYQELVSIKAGIKQHESKSRSLIQRSAKLSSYVDKLAKAGEMRKRLQEFKQGKTE